MLHLNCNALAALLSILTILKECKANDLNFEAMQNDYKIKYEHVEVVSYNKNYVQYFKIKTFKFNRTCTAFNSTFKYKRDLDNFEMIIQAYKFASNEYRLFPLRVQIKMCTVFEKNLLGLGAFTKCRNFDGCPMKKDQEYEICNFVPDDRRFPPFIPSGRYMTEMQGLYHSDELLVTRSYAEVYRPFKG